MKTSTAVAYRVVVVWRDDRYGEHQSVYPCDDPTHAWRKAGEIIRNSGESLDAVWTEVRTTVTTRDLLYSHSLDITPARA